MARGQAVEFDEGLFHVVELVLFFDWHSFLEALRDGVEHGQQVGHPVVWIHVVQLHVGSKTSEERFQVFYVFEL